MDACHAVVATPWHFSVGVSIGLLALIGVLIPLIHEKIDSRTERAVWIVALTICLFSELWSIRWDQIERNREQEHADCEQLHNFEGIAEQLETTRQKMDQNLAETRQAERMAKDNLRDTRRTEDMAKTNLAELSGEGSHPCIVPDEMAMAGDMVPFSIWNRGENVLTGVEVSITNMKQYQVGRAIGNLGSISVGTLPPEWPKTLPAIQPVVDWGGIAHYEAQIWTQNGVYDEAIQFKPAVKGSRKWAERYWLDKQIVFKGPTKEFPHMEKGDRMPLNINDCRQVEWSDGSKGPD
jgi:hypothetical protein